ncbi:hypothetical protein T492DRAFT_151330 [Pavlovales sp. CCMP2436]|nr:hypothetical protein T492DRAFT_151330 [Pavlovales sp. CCMP2436]
MLDRGGQERAWCGVGLASGRVRGVRRWERYPCALQRSLDPSVSQRLGPVETCQVTDVNLDMYSHAGVRLQLVDFDPELSKGKTTAVRSMLCSALERAGAGDAVEQAEDGAQIGGHLGGQLSDRIGERAGAGDGDTHDRQARPQPRPAAILNEQRLSMTGGRRSAHTATSAHTVSPREAEPSRTAETPRPAERTAPYRAANPAWTALPSQTTDPQATMPPRIADPRTAKPSRPADRTAELPRSRSPRSNSPRRASVRSVLIDLLGPAAAAQVFAF